MSTSKWSKEQVKKMLQEDNFSYQKIELPYGLSTRGADRSSTANQIFPNDMAGKSVLDIGSKHGYFCFEALKRGATRVLGVDVDPDSIKKARVLADCLGVEASFELLDIESDPIHEKFDYVLCLNVLHHLNNPISTLDKLAAITRERLILEVAGLGRYDQKKLKVPLIPGLFLNKLPIIFVASSGKSGRPTFQKFLITPSAIEHIFMHQRGIFARVDHVRSEHHNRTILVIHKRKVENLILVAGPLVKETATLINKLQSSELPGLKERLGMDNGIPWTIMAPNQLSNIPEPHIKNLIFQYDLLRPFLRSAKVHKRDPVLEILDTADHLTFLTLWHSPDKLQEAWTKTHINPKMKFGGFWGKKRDLILQKEFKESSKIRAFYQSWFEFSRTKVGKHIIVCLENGSRFYTFEEWEELTLPYEKKN